MSMSHIQDPPPALDLFTALPADTVFLGVTAATEPPMRPPADAWALLVRAVELRPPVRLLGDDWPSPSLALTVATPWLAGVWLAAQPPADVHDGDVVLRLSAPADGSPMHVDVELQSARNGVLESHKTWPTCGPRWPRIVAPGVHSLMTIANDAMPDRARATELAPISRVVMDSEFRCGPRRPLPGPDALAELIHAGLLHVGTRLRCGPHEATVAAGGVLVNSELAPVPFRGLSTVTSRASALAGCPVNGWDLWRLPDGRTLNALRNALAASR